MAGRQAQAVGDAIGASGRRIWGLFGSKAFATAGAAFNRSGGTPPLLRHAPTSAGLLPSISARSAAARLLRVVVAMPLGSSGSSQSIEALHI